MKPDASKTGTAKPTVSVTENKTKTTNSGGASGNNAASGGKTATTTQKPAEKPKAKKVVVE
ncbi:hypothetical protein [Chryseobacterium wanjuense]